MRNYSRYITIFERDCDVWAEVRINPSRRGKLVRVENALQVVSDAARQGKARLVSFTDVPGYKVEKWLVENYPFLMTRLRNGVKVQEAQP